MMILEWFDTREVAKVGAALADQLAPREVSSSASSSSEKSFTGIQGQAMQAVFQRAQRDVQTLRLNFYKRAKLANAFKWRLIENGVGQQLADELTHRLVLLSLNEDSRHGNRAGAGLPVRPALSNAKDLLAQADKFMSRGAYKEAIPFYLELLELNPRHVVGLINLGGTLCKLGRLEEGEECFRRAIGIDPNYSEAHGNLGNVLRWKGQSAESEIWLRRSLKLNPSSVDTRYNLGLTLVFLGRLREAKAQYRKVLKVRPRHADALFGMGYVAGIEGGFDEAAAFFRRALEVNPKMPSAWASLAGIRKMSSADGAWLEGAEKIVASGISSVEEANVRFAIGKYWDDLEDFERAFHSYKRANELLKTIAENYNRRDRTRFVDDLIRANTRESITMAANDACTSMRPVFVVGMMRSGTTLTEQIISSHPAVKGAGELEFWSDAVRKHETAIRQGLLNEATRKEMAESYLRTLEGRSGDALRIVDKTPVNSDYLGIIHSVFPKARIIYMRRDPIDTCLSCYFQQLTPDFTYSMDLSDLAHYYLEHWRLMTHWRTVLPPGTILDVPYEELIADQEGWTRKMLQFIGVEWNEQCLKFQDTKRAVATASFWQVRQKIYTHSVRRWQNYEKFIRPLLSLRDLDPEYPEIKQKSEPKQRKALWSSRLRAVTRIVAK